MEITREMELPRPVEQSQKPQTNLTDAIESYIAFKSHRSDDVRRKAQLVLTRLQKFLELRKKLTVPEITLTDLAAFRATWISASTTQRRDQDSLRSFFRFCVRSKFISYNVAADLDPIKITRPKTEPFTSEEVEHILSATDRLTDEHGRAGRALALQTKAFVLVMRYSGLAIGDVAKLRKADVQGTRIRTSRKKTGKEVFCTVPQFVINALNAAPTTAMNTSSGMVNQRSTRAPASGGCDYSGSLLWQRCERSRLAGSAVQVESSKSKRKR
ncbi:MAG TPA: hypothetical protein VN519_08265 [Bryobacteraceae bacterium]|nr:hypothetical protein [Bryobacteraceae bacterium]